MALNMDGEVSCRIAKLALAGYALISFLPRVAAEGGSRHS